MPTVSRACAIIFLSLSPSLPVHPVHGARPMDTISVHVSPGILRRSVFTRETVLAASFLERSLMSRPEARTCPDMGPARPAITLRSVLFPHPFLPTRATSSPASVLKSMSLSSTFFPYPTDNPASSSIQFFLRIQNGSAFLTFIRHEKRRSKWFRGACLQKPRLLFPSTIQMTTGMPAKDVTAFTGSAADLVAMSQASMIQLPYNAVPGTRILWSAVPVKSLAR